MKLASFQKFLKKSGIDCALFFNISHRQQDWAIEYFTGIDDLEYGVFVVGQKSCFLVCFGFEYERFKKTSSVAVRDGGRDLFEYVKTLISKKKKIGFNFSGLDMKSFRKLKIGSRAVDVSSELLRLRQTKTAKELKHMKKAAAIGDKAIKSCFNRFSRFKTEVEVSNYLLRQCADHGVEFSFPAIVASGKNAAVCHHVPTSKLKKGFCIIDFGVKYKGYCSDMTRTLYLGSPSKKEREIYDLLLSVQKLGVKRLVPGAGFLDIDNYVREKLGKFERYFIHRFGHSLGMDVHDPLAIDTKKLIFLKNMVYTMEPGIYVPGKFGIRIEDAVVVGKKPVVLTKTSKKLCVVRR